MSFTPQQSGTNDSVRPVRARNPITRSQPHHRRKFPSHKAGRMLYCESPLEYDFLLHCEFSSLVIGIAEQPESIWYEMDGRKRRYTPDFRLETTMGSFLIEVKPAAKLEDPDTFRKFAILKTWYGNRGDKFIVVTDRRIRTEPRLANLKMLLHERRRSLSGVLGSEYADSIRHLLPCKLTQLATHLESVSVVMALLAAGHLHCDLNQRLDLAVVTLNPNEENDHVTSFVSH